MVRKKKGQSQEDALHVELTPARKLRQEIAQSNALLIYARLGWGGIGLPKNNTPPVGSLTLQNAIVRYYNTVTSATTLTDIERAYADLHRPLYPSRFRNNANRRWCNCPDGRENYAKFN